MSQTNESDFGDSWNWNRSFEFQIWVYQLIYLIQFIKNDFHGMKMIWVLIYLYYVTDILKHELYLMNFS